LTTLTLNVPAGRAETSSVVLSGKVGLVKDGAGSQTLTGLHTTTQPTVINAGTLVIDGSLAGSSTLVNAGATLQGRGTVGALTIAAGGTLAPGDGPGALRSGTLQWAIGSHFALELADPAASDVLSVTGFVSLAGDLEITLLPNFVAGPGDKFFLILNDGTELASGVFPNAPGGIVRDAAGHSFSINYRDNGDAGAIANDISLTVIAVPEPSSIALLAGVGLLAGMRRRRGRRTAMNYHSVGT
jgi:autotransporter-associated beta strand protein